MSTSELYKAARFPSATESAFQEIQTEPIKFENPALPPPPAPESLNPDPIDRLDLNFVYHAIASG
jgi:hypothetical protein